MHYCSSCRRHLNGALVCPGCGACSPDMIDGHTVPTPAPLATHTAAGIEEGEFTAPVWHDGVTYDVAAAGGGMDEVPQTGPSNDMESVSPAPQGRAARRRQRARWKKNRRRAMVATTVAFVGGGLALASTDRHSTDRPQASTALEVPGTDATEEQTAKRTGPSLPQTGKDQASPTPPRTRAADVPQRQPAAAAAPRTTPSDARPDVPATPDKAEPRLQQLTSSPPSHESISVGTGASDEKTPTFAPTTASDDTAGSGTPEASPAPATTTPSDPQLCLLTICLG